MTITESRPKKRPTNKGVPLPKARDKLFTVAENKLLDQITQEICEAWAKDLKVMRDCHMINEGLAKVFLDMFDCLKSKTVDLEEFLAEESKLQVIHQLNEKMDLVRQDVLCLFNRVGMKRVEETIEHNKSIDANLNMISLSILELGIRIECLYAGIIEIKQRRWWQFWR
jgi:hypothetical protein